MLSRSAPLLLVPLLAGLAAPPAIAASTDPPAAPNPLQTACVRVVDQDGEPIAGVTVAPWAILSELGHSRWTPEGRGLSKPPVVQTGAMGVAEFQYPKYASPSQKIECQQITCRLEHPDYADTVYNDAPVPQTGGPTEFTMSHGAVVRIRPLDENLEPATNGVHVMWSEDSYWSAESRPGLDNGAFTLPHLTAGEEVVRLVLLREGRATHFSPALPFVLAEGDAVDLIESLAPAVQAAGRLDESVPRPVRNGRVVALVLARASGEGNESVYWETWSPVAADGTFLLEGLPAGEPMQVIALCDGYVATSGEPPAFATDRERAPSSFQMPQVFELPAEGIAKVTISMEPTCECEFIVTGPQGNPVKGIKVHAWPNVKWWGGGSQVYCDRLDKTEQTIDKPTQELNDSRSGGKAYGRPFMSITDSEGRAVLKNLPAGSQSYSVSEPRGVVHAYASQRDGKVQVQPGRRPVQEVRLSLLEKQ